MPNVDACARIHFQMKIFDLSASTNLKQGSFFFKFYLQAALFKFALLNFNLRASFARLFNFKLLSWRVGYTTYIEYSSFQTQQNFLSYSNILASNVLHCLLRLWAFFWSLGVQNTVYRPLKVICGSLVEISGLRFKQKFLTVSKFISWKSG